MSYNSTFNKPAVKNFRRSLRKNSTDAERKLWSKLRRKQLLGYRFLRQYSVGPYILDFYCPSYRLGLELDGSQHLMMKNYDKKRTQYFKKFNIKLIRFWDNDVLRNIDGVVLKIVDELTPPINPS